MDLNVAGAPNNGTDGRSTIGNLDLKDADDTNDGTDTSTEDANHDAERENTLRTTENAVQVTEFASRRAHAHGEQVVLPVLGPEAAEKFPVLYGTARHGETSLFVSRALDTVSIPIRVNCPRSCRADVDVSQIWVTRVDFD